MSLFESAIGWLAPPQCVGCGLEGRSLCRACTANIQPFGERCWRCDALSPGGRTCPKCRLPGAPRLVWISATYDGLARELTSLYKFGHQRAAAEPIAQLMVDNMLRVGAIDQDDLKSYLVIPVPTATGRVRERGFGHSELLARKVGQKLRLDYSNALRRLGQARQLGSTRQSRLTQLEGRFSVRRPGIIAARRILLVDDVLTTGGTLMAATKTLRAAGARRVDALLFAKRL